MQRIETSRGVARTYQSSTVSLPSGAPTLSGWLHPRFRRLPPPVIVVGMHRSGTSLVSGMLGALGVYVGPEFGAGGDLGLIAAARAGRQSGYAEAAAFFRINELLLRAARCTWSRVEPFLQRRSQPAWSRGAELLLRMHTGHSLLRDFLQPLPGDYRGAWGWKDPRNSLTLPLWLKLFPDARIIHVVRDPEATVRSLHQRALLWEASRSQGNCPPRSPLRDTARKLGVLAPLPPDPCLSLDYCRELYQTYRQECDRAASGGQAVLQVRYEEILEAPESAARQLAGFAVGAENPEAIRVASAMVLRER